MSAPEPPSVEGAFDEGFVNERAWPPATPTDQFGLIYGIRVVRAGNVLIVVDDTGIPTDRSEITMARAVHTAVPNLAAHG